MDELYEQINALRKKRVESLLKNEEIRDYSLKTGEGEVKLSSFFGEKKDLIVIHNMGKSCPYCTLWADGFNGMLAHFEDRAGFLVVSPDKPDVQAEFSTSRGWKFKMVSDNDSFTADMGFMEEGKPEPGFSTFTLKEGKIVRVASDSFGPGDDYCSLWHMFGLLSDGVGGWGAKFSYS